MEEDKILNIAQKCLNCKHRPCVSSCPMKTNIPDFISQVKKSNYKSAYDILLKNNIFSYICGSICPQEEQCQAKCTRGIKGEAIKIGELEKYVNQWAKDNNYEYNIEKQSSNNIKVAIIGSGPAGLSCAFELIKKGFDITVYEKDDKLGGILTYGVPDFRLSKEMINNIVKKLINLGVKFINNCEFGKNIDMDSLKSEGYKAIFLGTGAQNQVLYDLSEKRYDNIYDSATFLKKYNEGKFIPNLGDIVVIGGRKCCYGLCKMCRKDASI